MKVLILRSTHWQTQNNEIVLVCRQEDLNQALISKGFSLKDIDCMIDNLMNPALNKPFYRSNRFGDWVYTITTKELWTPQEES